MYEGKGANYGIHLDYLGENIIQRSIKKMKFRVNKNSC